MPLPIYVLSLPAAASRRAPLLDALNRLGLAATLIDGVTPETLSESDHARYDRARCLGLYGVDMLPGEVGCYLAHERAWTRLCDDGHAMALILEDDATLADSLPALLETLSQTDPATRPWQVVRLASLRAKAMAKAVARHKTPQPLGGPHALYRLKTHVLGLQGYVMTAEGARRMRAYGEKIFMPVDHMMDRYWENGLDPYIVFPFPVGHQDALPSAIGTRDPRRRYAQGKGVLWRRRLNRWRDGVAKRWYALRHP
ncbi:glycosyltransferase family 25 protein [Pararhodospirillum photometricum]|nr:glycosyltransferase family 25 protein [Pararhodospirillum photometricum]